MPALRVLVDDQKHKALESISLYNWEFPYHVSWHVCWIRPTHESLFLLTGKAHRNKHPAAHTCHHTSLHPLFLSTLCL